MDKNDAFSHQSLNSTKQDDANSIESTLKPISREYAFLETFCYTLAQFQFDRAHELAEKEKDSRDKPTPNSIWTSLLNVLTIFSNAEKNYYSMVYIERKLFKSTTRPLYANLSAELLKQDGSPNLKIKEGEAPHGVEALALDLRKQLNQFIQARMEMIDFYEFMTRNTQHIPDIIKRIIEISEEFSRGFHHPILDPLKTSFTHEVDIVQTLFQTEAHLSEWDFLPSLLSLRESQTKLQAWSDLSPTTSVKEQLFSTFSYKTFFTRTIKRQSDVPFLYQWLNQFYLQMVSKFTLYFYTALSAQAPATDLKAVTAKTDIDYMNKLHNFQKKTDTTRISLVLDTTTKKNVFCGHGYHLESTGYEKPTGLNSYPSVINIPDSNHSKEHWPNVISLINNKCEGPKHSDKVIYFYDTKLGSSYYCLKVDVRIYIVLIYETKKKERDNYIQTFLADIKANLNHDALYGLLRPSHVKSF